MVINNFQAVINVSRNKQSYADLCNNGYFVFHAFNRNIENPGYSGVLSVNCAFEGEEFYKVDNLIYLLTYSNYLILNEATRRSSYILSDKMVESFSVNFSQIFIKEYSASFNKGVDTVFDDPFNINSGPIYFFEQLYEHDLFVSPLLFQIRHLINNNRFHQLEMDELVCSLFESMVLRQNKVGQFIRSGNTTKYSTRMELYKRLTRARDYIFSCFKEDISIDGLSRVACLNQHYFLREFKKMFKVTPYGYVQSLRLREAARLLKSTDKMTIEICQEVGYNDSSSFCRLFKKEFNCSPMHYRFAK